MIRALAPVLLIACLLVALPLRAQDGPTGEGEPPAAEGHETAPAPVVHRHAPDAGDQALIGAGIVLLCLLSGYCLLALAVAYFPDLTARLASDSSGSFLKRFLVGAANTAFLFILGKASGNTLFVFILPALALLFVAGLIALCDHVGRKLQLVADAEWNRLTRLGVGWTTLYFAGWFPFLGWFVLAPVIALTAIGTAILWLLRRRSAAAPAPSPAPAAPPPPPAPPAA